MTAPYDDYIVITYQFRHNKLLMRILS